MASSRCTLIYIYTFIHLFFLGDSPKKDMVKISTKKMNSSILFHKLPELPDGCLCFSLHLGFFFTFAVWWGNEWPWFTKERRSRVYPFPADARRSLSQDLADSTLDFRWISVGGASHRIIFQQPPTFHTQGLRFCSRFIGGQQTLLCNFLVTRNHRFGHESRVSILYGFYRFFVDIFFPQYLNSMAFFLITDLSACCSFLS